MLKSISNFANDPIAIEKSLKLLQSTSQIAANIGYWSTEEAAQWTTAKNQFNLARRFFRLFKWIDCWTAAYNQYEAYKIPTASTKSAKESQKATTPAAQDSVHLFLLVSKWSLLGMYLFLEFFTTIDAVLGTWRPWAVTLQIESLKFWFYALAVSVVLDLFELFFVYPAAAKPLETTKDIKKNDTSTGQTVANGSTREKAGADSNAGSGGVLKHRSPSSRDLKRRGLYRQLVIDSCDLIIPGAAVGWLDIDPVTVGVAGTISALVGGSDAWARVNASRVATLA